MQGLTRKSFFDTGFQQRYTLGMIVSESKISNSADMEEALIALPILRRWLLRSYPVRNKGEGKASVGQLRVIIHLHQHGPMMMTELARGLGISCSTATECVSELEARGSVLKTRSVSDRRGVVVSLMPDTEAMASKAFSYRRGVLVSVLDQMSAGERKAFVKGLTLLARSAEVWMDEHAAGGSQTDTQPAEHHGPVDGRKHTERHSGRHHYQSTVNESVNRN